MTKSIIKVSNISKRYRLGLKEKQADTLIGQLTNIIKSPYENYKRLLQLSKFSEDAPSHSGGRDDSVFWALKDINFEVQQGEVLGIIGKNGAGKSTLLKILSQITEPTSGKIEIHGRVASLLEVGTGFHPELSGRENIYMNGTILGMTRREIDHKLDEIIDFSGVEKFIDTPVKFYSSGMKVRLGFSVAAHLDPEILIIDEVLAVGDYEFQQKCLGKMEDVSKNQGRTVLFVSHNLDTIKALCNSSILLNSGKVNYIGKTQFALEEYLGQDELRNSVSFDIDLSKPNIYKIQIEIQKNVLRFFFHFESPFELKNPCIGIVLYNQSGSPILGSNARYHSSIFNKKILKTGVIEGVLRNPELHTGIYKLSAWLGDDKVDYDVKYNAVVFEYVSNKAYTQKPDPLTIGSIDKFIEWNYK
ncbi:ABC transporter ATP-binding protein [Mongoliitalea daihaiensis]|uniref:ABC transporter ATP-binding protein n=1 Tax=Mongoliitalea daihaiensis TaxID=2782006 RepID=UPI001F1EF0E1|nr:ABC transporter ATP-binding protein [Mongoliitalea daihaiensis]